MRLVDAPGDLRDRVVEVLGWTTDREETALICRLPDLSAGPLPARWTDLPWRVEPEAVVGGATAIVVDKVRFHVLSFMYTIRT